MTKKRCNVILDINNNMCSQMIFPISVVFKWGLVFCQTHFLKFVLLNFHCFHLTILFKNRTFVKIVFSPVGQANCVTWFITNRSVNNFKDIFEILLMGSLLQNPQLDIGIRSFENRKNIA